MAHDADDKRSLFQRVVDDIVDQIRTGKLKPGDVLPTSRRMADLYDVASMTAQRALRELQTMGLTYGIVGKGTFVHPQAPDRIRVLDGAPQSMKMGEVITDLQLNAQLAEYLLTRDSFAEAALCLFTAPKAERSQRQAEFDLLAAIVDGQAKDFQKEYEQYKTRLVEAAGKIPDIAEQPPADKTAPKPARRRNPRK